MLSAFVKLRHEKSCFSNTKNVSMDAFKCVFLKVFNSKEDLEQIVKLLVKSLNEIERFQVSSCSHADSNYWHEKFVHFIRTPIKIKINCKNPQEAEKYLTGGSIYDGSIYVQADKSVQDLIFRIKNKITHSFSFS